MITYVMPTRDRAERLWETLRAIGGLRGHEGEVVVVDNASREAVRGPARLENGLRVRVIRLEENLGAAARNVGVEAADAGSEWVVMLDDDSHPVGGGLFVALEDAGEDVAAVMADIFLPGVFLPGATARAEGQAVPDVTIARTDAQARLALRDKPWHHIDTQWRPPREAGGLPEVFIGCGVAIRRRAFLEAGGYDAAFGYYAEEYDLAARLLMAGWRVGFDPRFVVHHHKVTAGRDMDLILHRLVRNNGWVLQRYAPEPVHGELMADMIGRYRRIAEKEGATAGYARGLAELRATIGAQARTPLAAEVFDRFTGLLAAREAIAAGLAEASFETAAIVEAGKNEWCVRAALAEAGVRVEEEGRASAGVLVIGTMSPGPMLDALELWEGCGRRVVAPWLGSRSREVALERVE